jgi:hypothetical protein
MRGKMEDSYEGMLRNNRRLSEVIRRMWNIKLCDCTARLMNIYCCARNIAHGVMRQLLVCCSNLRCVSLAVTPAIT